MIPVKVGCNLKRVNNSLSTTLGQYIFLLFELSYAVQTLLDDSCKGWVQFRKVDNSLTATIRSIHFFSSHFLTFILCDVVVQLTVYLLDIFLSFHFFVVLHFSFYFRLG